MAAMVDKLRLLTSKGPVELRGGTQTRAPQKIQVKSDGGKSAKEVTIKGSYGKSGEKGWLSGSEENFYHTAIKQAMMIAVQQVRLMDMTDPTSEIKTEEGIDRELAKEGLQAEIQAQIQNIAAGKVEVLAGGHKRATLQQYKRLEEMERNTFVKFSRQCQCCSCTCCHRRERNFVIHDGKFMVYANKSKTAKVKGAPYQLQTAKVFKEVQQRGVDAEPPFDSGAYQRLRVDFKEREDAKKGHIFLYPKDDRELKHWMTTFNLSRRLPTFNDRKAFKVAIGRAANGYLSMGWRVLVDYYTELISTKKVVKQMAFRLLRVNISKGWNKMKLVHEIEKEDQQMKESQRILAARFMSERLGSLAEKPPKPSYEVRENIISRIQQKFRTYRDTQIFERQYVISANNYSRLSQARKGMTSEIDWSSISLDWALKLALDASGTEFFEKNPGLMKNPRMTYSHVEFHNKGKMTLSVSDNGQSLTFTNPDPAGRKHLNKVDMSNFVNMDRISNIVLNTAPSKKATKLDKPDRGCWMTVNGPRVTWGKRAQDVVVTEGKDKDKEIVEVLPDESLGVDGYAVPKAISDSTQGGNIMFMTCQASLDSIDWDLEKNKPPQKGKQPEKPEEKDYTVKGRKLFLYVLGYRFMATASGDSRKFLFQPPSLVVKIPVPKDKKGEACTVGLDSSVIAAEVVEVREPKSVGDLSARSTRSGSSGLSASEKKLTEEVQILTGSESLEHIYGIKDTSEGSTASTYTTSVKYSMDLFTPDALEVEPSVGSAALQITMKKLQDSPQAREKTPISPEFAGGGVPLTLYTSHRGAWYDAALQTGQFRLDHVPNFIELNIQNLRLTDKTPPDTGNPVYRVKASICGVSVVSPPFHRSTENWKTILGKAEPYEIHFGGCKLCVPLPPGYFAMEIPRDHYANMEYSVLVDTFNKYKEDTKVMQEKWKKYCDTEPKQSMDPWKHSSTSIISFLDNYSVRMRPNLKLEIIKSDLHGLFTAVNYEQFTKPGGLKNSKKPGKVLAHAELEFQYMLVDQQVSISVFVGSGDLTKFPPLTHVESNKSETETGHVLNVDFCLRDREYVKGCMTKPGQHRTLCVGDSALLYTEEPILYPKNEISARRRFVKSYDKKEKDWPKKDRGAELRDPALSSEWIDSGLAEVQATHGIRFKQKVIPNYCGRQDILPHKFLLPLTEQEFQERQCPGVWPMIMNDVVKNPKSSEKQLGPKTHSSTVVDHLSHTSRKIPVHILAMYANGTCDIEVKATFMDNWRVRAANEATKEEAKYCLPGENMVISKDKAKPPKVILREVPTMLLQSAQTMSFNVYNAAYGSIEDIQKDANKIDPFPVPDTTPVDPKKDLAKPETQRDAYQERVTSMLKSDEFKLPAGPLPPDCSPAAAQYEWSLNVRCGSETEMHRLVSTIRQCMRLDSFSQAQKMAEYSARPVQMSVDNTLYRQLGGGQLEVVLVEARKLEPVEKGAAIGTALMLASKLTGSEEATIEFADTLEPAEDLSPDEEQPTTWQVNFRMTSDGKPVAYKNNQVQSSELVTGESPSWASLKQYQSAGGFVFKTGLIDPMKYRENDLVLEFEVCECWVGRSDTIGKIQLGLFTNGLLDMQGNVRNMWLPLKTMNEKGEVEISKTGELHIMARWLTGEKLILAPGQQQTSCISSYLKQIWPKVIAQRVKEPLYQVEAAYLHYNPNLMRGEEMVKEAPPDFHRRHVEALQHLEKYLDCVELRQQAAWQNVWDDMRKEIQEAKEKGEDSASLDELLQALDAPIVDAVSVKSMLEESSVSHLGESLEELLNIGLPASLREQYWLTFVGAQKFMAKEAEDIVDAMKIGFRAYEQFLQKGTPQRSDANTQLQEDAFHLAAMESSSPPNQEALDFHMYRLRRAQNVCTALLVMEDAKVAYCESLLIIAFYMLLPKSSSLDVEREENVMLTEASTFWMLYTLVNGAFKDYYGKPSASEIQQHGAYKANVLESALGGADNSPPRDPEDMISSSVQPLCVSSGAMDDVATLEVTLAVLEPKIFFKFNAIGFMPATVFYGCFMRLYCTFMPTASVFRFWDFLMYNIGQDPASGRNYLISLAFGIIHSKADAILECKSAAEVKSLLLGCMGAMYDSSVVVELAENARAYIDKGGTVDEGITGAAARARGGVKTTAIANLLTEREDMFRLANEAIVEQNDTLRILTHELSLGNIPQTKYQSPSESKGVTTKELLKDVLPVMQQGFGNIRTTQMSGNRGKSKFWAMHRPMPLVAAKYNEGVGAKIQGIFRDTWAQVMNQGQPVEVWPVPSAPPAQLQDLNSQMLQRLTQSMDPAEFNLMDFKTVLEKDVPSWGRYAQKIWGAFTNRRDKHRKWKTGLQAAFGQQEDIDQDNPLYGQGGEAQFALLAQQHSKPSMLNLWGFAEDKSKTQEYKRRSEANSSERISLNEFYIALIICSRGTLGEKASALFDRYSYDDEKANTDVKHTIPTSSVGKSMLKLSEDSMLGLRNLYPPEDKTEHDNALCFEVWSNFPAKGTSVGAVYISKLTPFMNVEPMNAEAMTFNIWGLPPAMAALNKQRDRNQQNQYQNYPVEGFQGRTASGKVCIGEMELAISWVPFNASHKEKGQLFLKLKSIRFFKMWMPDSHNRNPWVTVNTFRGTNPQHIQRWDPQKKIPVVGSGQIEFHQTMISKGSTQHPVLKEHFRQEKDTGWVQDLDDVESGTWVWSKKYGEQYSTDKTEFDIKFMGGGGRNPKKNVMDMLGVRLIVTGILTRSMLNVTNRQAILIADSLFNRQGAVPGIIEAVLMRGTDGFIAQKQKDRTCEDKIDLEELKKKFGVGVTDVTEAVMLEHEKQVQFDGTLNMFKLDYLRMCHPNGISLADIGISDPYGRMFEKMLWINYVRSGDGQRCTQGVRWQRDGRIFRYSDGESPEVKIDLLDSFPQTKVTKEEFVSCLLSSPLLGESMRRIASTDHILHAKQAIPLDVTIMDPHHDEEAEQFMDAMNVQQSILLEVWDKEGPAGIKSAVVGSHFLGEAWLPPLSDIQTPLKQKEGDKPIMKEYVLNLKAADYDKTADPWASREDRKKIKVGAKEAKDIKGELHIAVAWEFPHPEWTKAKQDKCKEQIESQDQAKSLDARSEFQVMMHTGKLTLHILKAYKLKPDTENKGQAKAQVVVWRRNDVSGEFDDEKEYHSGTSTQMKDSKGKPTEWVDWTTAKEKNHECELSIPTGNFELRYPDLPDGVVATLKNSLKRVFRPKAKRFEEEDHQIQAVKGRYGAKGLKLMFLETPQPSKPEPEMGENHGVEVFLGDTIREFKQRLTEACQRESDFWRNRGAASASKATIYSDVHIGYKHLVMVFMPSSKVMQLVAQKKTDNQEYQHSYTLAIQDPASWQPLDPTRTFGQYPQYGFGRKQAVTTSTGEAQGSAQASKQQRLRIVEETESYKVLNHRYREFAKERDRESWKDINKKEQCYGWAKYTHPLDNTTEWRPAMLKASGTPDQRKAQDPSEWGYKVNWCFPPFNKGGEPQAELILKAVDEEGERQVMLHPRYPMFEDIDPLHEKILTNNGKSMKQLGKSDWEIQEEMNKKLDELKNHLTEKGELKRTVPPITVDIVRHFLKSK
mmetsp:Transcript_14093/g.26206  ORF Transcript_14093/g.26206 Transcript_14093/m.26206 type:complete len:3581 (+) Transcript_14093:145-10887(+)